ncbi:hypothetical protein L0Y65_03475 [Candidatus Micrarchaeota archaeon]|nr:hypothetical protein [Candidatus Micrarchaeota archaeon]
MQLRSLALFLFAIAPLSFPAAAPLDLTFAVPVMAVIVAAFLGVANMLSHSLSDPRLDAWVKTEMREFFAAIILIIIVIAAVTGTNGVAFALTGDENMIASAQGVLDGWLGTYDSAFEYIIKAAGQIRSAATYSPYLNIPVWYFSINYSTNTLGGIAIMLGPLSLASQALTNAIFLSESLRMLLAFLKIVVPLILLPIAFIARLIPFSRKLGNTLIALSIAGIVFLPFSVLVASALNSTITMPNPTMKLNKLDANPWAMVFGEFLCSSVPVRSLLFVTEQIFSAIVCLPLILTPWTVGLYQQPCREPLMHQVVYPLIQLIFQIVSTVLLLIWEIAYSAGMAHSYAEDVFKEVLGLLRAVNNLVLVAYIDFIIIGTITMAGARSLSSALGGEWYMAGVQRLI